MSPPPREGEKGKERGIYLAVLYEYKKRRKNTLPLSNVLTKRRDGHTKHTGVEKEQVIDLSGPGARPSLPPSLVVL